MELRQQYPNGAHEAFSDLSAHASRRLLWLGFEVHYLALLVVCRIGRIQPDHPPLSTFNIQAGSALGMPAEAPTIAAAPSRRWATPPARANRPPETKDSAARWDARPADDLVASVVDHLLEVTLVFVFIFVRSRLSGSSHEGLNLLDRDGPIFVGIHRLEDFFVSGLKFLQ